MTRNDTGLLVVTSGVASQLKNFGRKIFENSGEVDGSTSADTLGVVALAEETVDTADRECETSLRRTAIGKGQLNDTGHVWQCAKFKLSLRIASRKEQTYDCAFLEPLALPPDLPPPVILMLFLGDVKKSCGNKARINSTKLQ